MALSGQKGGNDKHKDFVIATHMTDEKHYLILEVV
jgi:hypothetical protein